MTEGVTVEQVEDTKPRGEVVHSRLSWAKHIDSLVTKMGSNTSVVKRCASSQLTKQVLQTLALKHLDYCLAVWSEESDSQCKTEQRGWLSDAPLEPM